MDKIPVSVLVMTLNEQEHIEQCLVALSEFDEVMVVDSASADKTQEISRKNGAAVVEFDWDGRYPKKRQWCLDNIEIKHEWVLFVDADEIMTAELADEIMKLFKWKQHLGYAGFFIKGRYVVGGRELRYGLKNNKLCLINRHDMEFPVIDDLEITGMGEIEGHYQPVVKADGYNHKIGSIRAELLHYAQDNTQNWQERHQRYAVWEAGMIRNHAFPQEPLRGRQMLKDVFRNLPVRGIVAFLHSYVLKAGFLDGRRGFDFALSRAQYYVMVQEQLALTHV